MSCGLMRPVSAAEGRCRICDRNRIVLGLLGGGGTCTGLALGAVAGGWWLGWPGAIAGSVIGAVTVGMLVGVLTARVFMTRRNAARGSGTRRNQAP